MTFETKSVTFVNSLLSLFLKDPGKLKIQPDGFYFKSSKSGKAFHVSDADLDIVEWMRVARGHEVKVFTKDGNITKFAGFKESVSQWNDIFSVVCRVCLGRKGGGVGEEEPD